MSQAEELLNSLSVETTSTNDATEGHIVIGNDRFITVPEELKRIGVQYDHNVETVTFDCPRYWDGLDMSQMRVYINYMLPDKTKGCYLANNIVIDNANPNIMHFDWTISRNVTKFKGHIHFIVCIRKVNEMGNVINDWNSELSSDMYVSEGLEYEGTVEEEYPDIITSLLDRMEAIEEYKVIDTTLTKSGIPADSKTVGDKVNELQGEIDAIVLSASESGDVTAEVAQARVNANGETFSTLKNRLDHSDVKESKNAGILNDIIIPNLIDVESMVHGYFVRYDNGKVYSQASYSYVYCDVKENTKYELLGEVGFTQIVFFNGDIYISGIDQCPKTFETPGGTTRIALSFSNAYTNTIVCRELEPATSKSLIKNSALDMDYIKGSTLNDIVIPNLIDIDSRVQGYFIMYSTGKAKTQSSYSYVYCDVKENTKYELLGDNGYTQIAFFSDTGYISGVLQCPKNFETPKGTTRIALSFSNAYTDTIVCRELNTSVSKSLIKNSALDMEYITDYVNGDTSGIVKTVDISGGGDFTTIADAIAYAGTQTSKVIIKVKNGVYEELMIDFKGNFELIGESRTGVIIRADGASVSEEYKSYNNRHIFMNVANADTNAKFKNLTIEAFNVKYCFHFDNPGNHKFIVENCTMQNNNPSVGCGIWSNQKITIKDCDITYLRGGETGIWTCGVFAHNWTEQEKECYFYMENVKVKDAQLLHIQCLASGHYDTFKVVNSTSSELGNIITVIENTSNANQTINLILEGDKYSIVYDPSFTNHSLHQEGVFDTYIYNNTGSTITQYTALQYDYSDTEQGRKSVEKSDGTNFVGVALNDIAPGSYGYMAYTGRCIKYSDTITEGTTYTINSNGQFEQSSTNIKAVCIKGQKFLGESSQRKMLYLIE